ncbi:MAG: hypothetical protein LBB47_04225 [Spirochaetaceae bacterium]|nr:hypothetical protein [Spirochaetaceae bacterium]
MPGCDIPPSTPAENIKAMSRLAHTGSGSYIVNS